MRLRERLRREKRRASDDLRHTLIYLPHCIVSFIFILLANIPKNYVCSLHDFKYCVKGGNEKRLLYDICSFVQQYYFELFFYVGWK